MCERPLLGREIAELGHDVRLIAPIYVKPFVKRQKNDTTTRRRSRGCAASDHELRRREDGGAAGRGMLFRTRDLLVRQRTQTINALRGHLAEFGIVAPQGPAHVMRLARALEDPGLRDQVRTLGTLLFDRIEALDAEIAGLEKEVGKAARRDDDAARLMTIPGIGPVTAMALQAFAPPLESFRRGRDFAAWLGLVPRQHTTGGKPRLGRSRRGASAISGGC